MMNQLFFIVLSFRLCTQAFQLATPLSWSWALGFNKNPSPAYDIRRSLIYIAVYKQEEMK